ncbi:MAG: hypothetical protein Q8M24_20670 [Pseudolabrys sp.]|nr:hypothetical protein [Pseudolabrys sp.]MDP2297866.1 hypothetical protein [Pseudolabrys sp.]
MAPRPATFFRQPLIRLLAINLAIGVSAAVLMLGGLMAINPYGLRDLIFSDRSGGAAIGLLLFGLVVTFGSVAMGTAIMTLGKDKGRAQGGLKTLAAPAPAFAATRRR